MHKEVFATKEFTDYAAKRLVLVSVDFPKRKKLSAAQQKANDALSDQFKIEAYPTVVVLDNAGRTVSREVGYDGKGPTVFIGKLDKLKAK